MSHPGRIFWCLLATALGLAAQVNVTTYQYDLGRTGANTNEFILNKANVRPDNFGLLYTYPVDGMIYGQPLYVANVNIPGKGTHNVVYVATENDSVYAFDADSGAYGGPLWQINFLSSGAVTVSSDEVSCGQIRPQIGITSTPVIDLSRGAIYVVAMTREGGNYVQRLHALDLSTGAEKIGSPVEIQATYPGTGEGGSTVVFNPRNYKQRPGLMLLNGVVYTAWASHCDIGAYHGWLIGYDAGTLQQVSVYNNTPNGNQGSFWNGGAAPAADENGNIYVVSGNGDFDGGQNLGESYIKLSSAGGLAVADYFTPFNYIALNGADLDTGSAGVALIGDEAGSPAHPHLMTSAGKEGRIYLIDRDNMGKLNNGSDSQIPQSVLGGMPSLFGNPAYFNHSIYYCGSGSYLGAYSISNAQMSTAPVSQSYEKYGYPGCVPNISSNGRSNGIVWTLEPFVGLHAYDADNLGHELYNSGPDASPGNTVKYSAPTVANGKVYAGRDSLLAVYGLLAAGAVGLPAANSASGDVGSVAPGGLTSIYGSGLAAGTESATGFPLPTALAGASVTVGGYSAPMLYASPGQVNFQIPFEVPPGTAVFTVLVNGTAVASGSLNVLATAPGVFMMDGGRAAVVNQNGSLNSLGSPASAGSVVSVYATGLGAVSPQVASGAPAPSGSIAYTTASVTVTVGTAAGQLQFAGLAPGFAGLYQVNFVVPSLPAGQYALKISAGGTVSNVATIAVQ
jgi:uncharacterized protein (TIGR03437 family)